MDLFRLRSNGQNVFPIAGCLSSERSKPFFKTFLMMAYFGSYCKNHIESCFWSSYELAKTCRWKLRTIGTVPITSDQSDFVTRYWRVLQLKYRKFSKLLELKFYRKRVFSYIICSIRYFILKVGG